MVLRVHLLQYLLKQGHLEQATQEYVEAVFEDLQEGILLFQCNSSQL